MRSASVSQALQSLSPAHRQVLNETYFRNRSVNEAARVLGLPVDTVKSRVYDALHALRVNMGQVTSAGDQLGRHRAPASAPAVAPTPLRRGVPGSGPGQATWAAARPQPRPYAERWI